MTAFIRLDDGRCLWRSNVIMASLYSRVSDQVSADHPRLKRWLRDLSDRCAPFTDIDIRGLVESDRVEFYAAASKAAHDKYSGVKGGSTEALEMLLRMKESIDRGEPPLTLSDFNQIMEFDGTMEDLDQLWSDEEHS